MKLHHYQERAVQHLHRYPRSALFMEMGLGKTATVLSALTPDHLPALVIAPKRVAEHVWPAEQRLWRPNLSLSLAVGKPDARTAALSARSDITVIGRDSAKDITPATVKRYRTVVIDELSGYKSRKSLRWRHARAITKDTAHVWGLTGTPAPNGLLDLWAQLFLLDRGERLDTAITRYRERYFDVAKRLPQTGAVIEWRLKPGAETSIHHLIDDICLSMQSADYLELPSVTFNNVAVSIPALAKKAYEDLRADLVTVVDDVLGPTAVTAANAAVLSGKLSQVTAGFLYDEDGATQYLHAEKTQTLQEVIDGTGSPVLVFYRFKEELRRLREFGAAHIDDRGVIERWNAGEVPVLCAHPASASHGLNLQHGGHTIAWMSLDWDLELYLQANARLARQGQTKPVVVHHLTVPGSVDVEMVARLRKKKRVEDALMDALSCALP